MDQQTTIQKRYFATERRVHKWGRIEGRVAHWLQGWTIIVAAGFVSKIWLEALPWWGLAALAGSHTVMYVLLLTINARRWGLEYRRRDLEKRFSGS